MNPIASLKSLSVRVGQEALASLRAGLPAAKSLTLGLMPAGNPYAGYGGAWNPGTHINYGALAGDLWQNSAVSACLNWMITAFPEAPPCLMERGADGKLVIAEDDPLGVTGLLESPNNWYDDTVLWAGTLISYSVAGNAYWFIVRDATGRPCELWYIPHFLVQPRRVGGDFISYYEYRAGGQYQQMAVEDVVHFRFGVNLYDTMLGAAPLSSIEREVYTDNQSTNYTAAIMKNMGAVGGVASWDGTAIGDEIDASVVRDNLNARTNGDNAGSWLAMNTPITLSFPDNSPEKMALDTIRRYPETRICAVLGIPPMLVGLASGLDASTYSNMEQAEDFAWRSGLLPVQRAMARQATRQLVRRWPGQNDRYSLGFDTREVRALREDVDAIHERAREDFKANLVDRATAKREMGLDPDAEDEGLYYADIAPPGSGGFDEDAERDAALVPTSLTTQDDEQVDRKPPAGQTKPPKGKTAAQKKPSARKSFVF